MGHGGAGKTAFLLSLKLWQTQGDVWLAHRVKACPEQLPFLWFVFFSLLLKLEELGQGGSERPAPPSQAIWRAFVKARCCAAVLVLGCEGLEDFFLLASISRSDTFQASVCFEMCFPLRWNKNRREKILFSLFFMGKLRQGAENSLPHAAQACAGQWLCGRLNFMVKGSCTSPPCFCVGDLSPR